MQEMIVNDSKQELSVRDGLYVSLSYDLFIYEGGELIFQEKGTQGFVQGDGDILPGLQRALYGSRAGDRKVVYLSAQDGFGERDAGEYVEIPLENIQSDVQLKPGERFHIELEDGDWLDGYIEAVNASSVRFSLNHPLAGKDLFFKVTINEIRHTAESESFQNKRFIYPAE
jgi:FKBP-type peptidyl-prolyl cis-trans isomerase 2